MIHNNKKGVSPRNQEIYKKWTEGSKVTDLAKDYNLSRTRIDQIINRSYFYEFGVTRTPNGLY